MGSTSDAAHGRLRSAIQSPTPPKTPGWRPCTRGAGAPRRPSLSPPALPPSSSPPRTGPRLRTTPAGKVRRRTGPGPRSGPPAHLLGRLGAAPPPRPGARQVPQRQDAHLHLQSEKAPLARLLSEAAPVPGGTRGERGCSGLRSRGGREGGREGGQGAGGSAGSAPSPRPGPGRAGGARLCRSRQAPSDMALQSGQSGAAAGEPRPRRRPISARAGGARHRARGTGLPPARSRFAPFLGAAALPRPPFPPPRRPGGKRRESPCPSAGPLPPPVNPGAGRNG